MPAQSSCVALVSNSAQALPGPFGAQGTSLQGQALQRPPGPQQIKAGGQCLDGGILLKVSAALHYQQVDPNPGG